MGGIILFPDDRPEDDAGREELRKFKRKPVLWGAKLETEAGSFDCIALDLSLGGAKLRLSATITLEQPVQLAIGRLGKLNAEVVWQQPGLIGVRFTDDPERIARILGRALPL
jgi:hypothetical protein